MCVGCRPKANHKLVSEKGKVSKKKAKRFSAMVLSMVLLFTSTVPVRAISGDSKAALFNHALNSIFAELDAPINDNAKIDFSTINSSSGQNGSGIVVTHTEGSIVTKDAFMFVDDNGVMDVEEEIETYVANSSFRSGTTKTFAENAKYVVRATAVYEQRPESFDGIKSFYQPIGAYFTYNKNKSCSITSMTLQYLTQGFEYNYPQYTLANNEYFQYPITVFSPANPAESTMYSKTDQYRSDRVIFISVGPLSGMSMNPFVTVDGKSEAYSTNLYL